MYRVHKRPIPLDYSKCDQTVTVYHREKGTGIIHRIIVHGAHLEFGKKESLQKIGSSETNGFLLVIPQSSCTFVSPAKYTGAVDTYTIVANDKILLGEGHEVTASEWASFIPATVEYLVVAQKVSPKFWENQICHVEVSR